MIKLERTEVMNFENAIRGMRNPLQSYHKADSTMCGCCGCDECVQSECCICTFYVLGPNDLNLAQRLCKAGSDHRKFLRQIFVSVDITAPLYWFKEFDTYKVGTTANSTSTMHKIHAKEFTIDDFSVDYISYGSDWYGLTAFDIILDTLNSLRDEYNKFKDKEAWYAMIQLLPSSYNQLRTCTLTYENLRNMYHSRKNHKLDEWHTFCRWVETLPYAKELIIGE